jgi:hypothetical protein
MVYVFPAGWHYPCSNKEKIVVHFPTLKDTGATFFYFQFKHPFQTGNGWQMSLHSFPLCYLPDHPEPV